MPMDPPITPPPEAYRQLMQARLQMVVSLGFTILPHHDPSVMHCFTADVEVRRSG